MSEIVIVPYSPRHAAAFRQLNLGWIERLFTVEAADRKVLDDPEGSIITPGGQILLALDGDKAVATVAMLRKGPARFELAKMAVADTHQRRGIGELLGAAAIAWARGAGAAIVCLETNRKLGGAIRLYQRLGFRLQVDPHASEFARCDVYMELPIEAAEVR
jgi:putative acetyltransferase